MDDDNGETHQQGAADLFYHFREPIGQSSIKGGKEDGRPLSPNEIL